MTTWSRRLPWLFTLALIFTFFTLCVSFGLQKGGSLVTIAERAALTMTFPLQKSIDWTFSTGSRIFNDYINLIGTKRNNAQLRKDLAVMTFRLAQLEENRLENQRLHQLLQFREEHDPLAQGLAAHVIGRQTDSLSHIFIIDCGSNHKLKVNDPVFTPGGVIGRIVACGPQSAKVLLLIDQNSACDVTIQRNRIHGTLQGTGDELCKLAYLQRTADVKAGDQLITSGLDNIFPKGITVGTVVSVNQDHNGLSQQIAVKLTFDLDTLEEVYVIPSATDS
ncbi:MAG: rod shape-determining protein MreC [Deltaproteobacteria bacterium]|nr:rod shape-determining protein MreC [Deltaproteobacteria bacterium]